MSRARGRADAYARWARSGGDLSFERTLAPLPELLPPPPLRVLDIGCGEGRIGSELAIGAHPFASGAKVARYSDESRYSWDVKHDDVDLQLGGIHRPLETYARAFEEAGLNLDTLREISVGPWDPMSLAMRFTRVSD